jgi:hypothetical protein
MSSDKIPLELSIPMEGACSLSLECWRLARIAELSEDDAERASLRHAVRRLSETLRELAIEAVDFVGRIYDPGMVPEVVEVIECRGSPEGMVVEETISPTVTWRGNVIKSGQIIVKRTMASPENVPRMTE